MNNNDKIAQHSFEMLAHSYGTAQFIFSLMGGGYITNNQLKETIDYNIASMKRNIESNPTLSREQKDLEIARRESWFNALKASMGLG